MNKHTFTREQLQQLQQNPYVFHATSNKIFFTKEFKQIFTLEHQAGQSSEQILIDHGFDPKVLGKYRVFDLPSRFRREYEKYGEFIEKSSSPKMNLGTCPPPSQPASSEREELNQLRHEVDYLKQQIEFLKKISSVTNTRK